MSLLLLPPHPELAARIRPSVLSGNDAPSLLLFALHKTDGRPMSGDIGKGATTACIRLAEKVLATQGKETFPQGYDC